MLKRLRRGDQGVTLVETLVSMIVFAIAIAIVYQVLMRVQTTVRDVDQSAEAISQVRQGLALIDRQVRSGNVLFKPGDEPTAQGCEADGTGLQGNCIRIYTQANGNEKCVQWQVTDEAAHGATDGEAILRMRSWAIDWPTSGAVTDWSTVARGLDASPSRYPFELEQTSPGLYGSRLLEVQIEAHDDRRDASVPIRSSLSGRNTNYGYDPGLCSPVP